MPEDWYEGRCKSCGAEVRARGNSTKDYHYFCTNPNCEHASGCDLYDLEDIPDWIEPAFFSSTPLPEKKMYLIIGGDTSGEPWEGVVRAESLEAALKMSTDRGVDPDDVCVHEVEWRDDRVVRKKPETQWIRYGILKDGPATL